jgi:hypothetical protein
MMQAEDQLRNPASALCRPAEGVVNAVVDELLARGQLWPGRGKGGEAMMRVQHGRMPGHVDRIKAHVAEKEKDGVRSTRFSNLAADRCAPAPSRPAAAMEHMRSHHCRGSWAYFDEPSILRCLGTLFGA